MLPCKALLNADRFLVKFHSLVSCLQMWRETEHGAEQNLAVVVGVNPWLGGERFECQVVGNWLCIYWGCGYCNGGRRCWNIEWASSPWVRGCRDSTRSLVSSPEIWVFNWTASSFKECCIIRGGQEKKEKRQVGRKKGFIFQCWLFQLVHYTSWQGKNWSTVYEALLKDLDPGFMWLQENPRFHFFFF